MSERNKTIILTPESNALKQLREKSGLSLRKLSESMGYSPTRINQLEVGRENITEPYIKKFLDATGLSWRDWNNELGQVDEFYEIREKCIERVKQIEPSKLELVHGLLSNF